MNQHEPRRRERETRYLRVCPDVIYGFLRGFVEVIEGNKPRYYRAPTDSSMARAIRVAKSYKHRVNLLDDIYPIFLADVPRGDNNE